MGIIFFPLICTATKIGCENYMINNIDIEGGGSGVEVKALRYKLAGRRFDSRRCHWNFSVT
jgi:hypothetical protein